MRILHVNTNDARGGAARATYRLHKALLNNGIDSFFFVQQKETEEKSIYSNARPYDKLMKQVIPFFDRVLLKTLYKVDPSELFSSSFFATDNIIKVIERFKPDIVHLNWISTSFINLKDIRKIKVPIIWTMHDSWVFTGGCHLPYNCEKFKSECGNCPKLNSERLHDLSNQQFKTKYKQWTNSDITFIAPSKWLFNCAKESFLLKEQKLVHLPNGIDTNFFSPVEKRLARNILGLNPDKRYILFGANNVFNDSNKGFQYLKSAILKLHTVNNEDIELLVFGMSAPLEDLGFKYKTTFFGRVYDEISMKLLYSAADLTLVPSLSENLSYVIMESMSHNTPVVAFNVGGNSDLIKHLVNGFLAETKNSEELAEGIKYILRDDVSKHMQNLVRPMIIENFEISKIVDEYINLYQRNIL